ncbi:MAG: XdhC family protein [Desulfobacterales bacterium]|jgi:xanthine dehydrogenase accessory factor|nr:XdhC family protein [Desulfobacterales bacterium]
MNLIAETAGRLLDDQHPFVLATIVNREGSAPRTAGTRMIVAADGRAVGTIGGGLLEARVVAAAGEVLTTRQPRIIPFDMTPSEQATMDMICGGRLEVLMEPIDPRSPAAVVLTAWREVQRRPDPYLFLTVLRYADGNVAAVDHCLLKDATVVCGDLPFGAATIEMLVLNHSGSTGLRTVALGESLVLIDPVLPPETVFLFGAGHVAQPTARLAAFAGFCVRVVDDRSDFANAERFPEAQDVRVVADFDSASKGLAIDRGAFVVIVTRGHLHDKTVLMQALRTEAAYIGMIGSRRKRDHIFNALLKQGVTQAELQRVHSPIGIDIGAETPEEIALSIVAELVQVRARRRRP